MYIIYWLNLLLYILSLGVECMVVSISAFSLFSSSSQQQQQQQQQQQIQQQIQPGKLVFLKYVVPVH